jgi:hypothetical protein
MSAKFTKLSYGCWVDEDANVHPVTQAQEQEHSGAGLQQLHRSPMLVE